MTTVVTLLLLSLPPPLPGQLVPDAKWRCPAPSMSIQGGCWIPVGNPPCPKGEFHVEVGVCWMPMRRPPKPIPTLAPGLLLGGAAFATFAGVLTGLWAWVGRRRE